MTMHFHSPKLPGKPFFVDRGKAGVSTWGLRVPVATLVMKAGRLNTVDGVLGDLPEGAIIARDDGKTSVQLRNVTTAKTLPAMLNGQPVDVEVQEMTQLEGWGEGKHYMLPIDPATGRLVLEPGRNHRKVYLTAGPHGYTRAMVAAEAGVSEATVTSGWLRNNPIWGGSPDKALAFMFGGNFWVDLVRGPDRNGNNFYPESRNQSNWLLFERGYDYRAWGTDNGRNWNPSGMSGESPQHPCVITSYGTGAKPLLGYIACWQSNNAASWVVFQDIAIERGEYNHGSDAIFSNVDVVKKGLYLQTLDTLPRRPHRTFYRVKCVDSAAEIPGSGRTNWDANLDRGTGSYVAHTQSLLCLECLYDHNGWSEGYFGPDNPKPEGFVGAGPKPPEMYSHNWYIQYGRQQVTMIRNISARSSSVGYQNRPGGPMIDNLSIDDEVSFNNLGSAGQGTTDNQPVKSGYYGLLVGNVATSTGQRKVFHSGGAKTWGFDIKGRDMAAIDNIAMHMADPNNPAELAVKNATTGQAVALSNAIFENTRVHRWDSKLENAATFNAAPAVLNQTTIQLFAQQRMGGGTKTIAQYMAHIRAMDSQGWVAELEAALAFFRTPWGLHMPKRTAAQTVVFRPDARGEGFRWDNPLNWSTRDWAGFVSGDNVSAFTDFLMFGVYTVTIGTLNMRGGKLEASSGKLTVAEIQNCPEVHVSLSGQVDVDADTNVAAYRASGGRLRFTGAVAGHDLTVTAVEWENRFAANPQLAMTECLLGPDHTISAGRTMLLDGPSWTGWDGTGAKTLAVSGTLRFQAYGGAMPQLRVFKVSFNDAAATATATVTLTGTVQVDTTGVAPGTYALTGPGVTVVNSGATLPAGVAVVGGVLRLTVS